MPKYLLLAAAIPMHWVVLLTPMPHKPIAIVAMLTIYHNLQYHRLVWFHNRKYTRDEGCRERHGAAEFISRRLFNYVVLGLLFGIWYQVPRQYVNVVTPSPRGEGDRGSGLERVVAAHAGGASVERAPRSARPYICLHARGARWKRAGVRVRFRSWCKDLV